MPKELVKSDGYKILVKKIQSELSELEFFVKRRTAEAYWKVGKFIHEHLLENKDRADYGHNLFNSLADDIDRDVSTLRRALKFYRIYPIRADQPELSWDHYKRLITVPDKDKREAFERMALKREWTAGKLEEAIRLDRLEIEEPKEKSIPSDYKLSVTRSRLFTYKVLEPDYIHSVEEQLVVDLGFNFLIQAEIKGLKLKAGELVESVPATKIGGSANYFGGKYSGYCFKLSDAQPKELYTYKAMVERVVDGDTIWLNIDLGFDSWSRQKVRLRGIDAPELSTEKGQRAKKFIEAKLKEVNFIVVKTHSPDKYGRYLTDIFFAKDATEPQAVLEQGVFLNQELLDLGLAERM